MIKQKHREQFETLTDNFHDGNVALVECRDFLTGEILAVIAEAHWNEAGQYYELIPMAQLFNFDWKTRIQLPAEKDGEYEPVLKNILD
jgi:hypothetical protein